MVVNNSKLEVHSSGNNESTFNTDSNCSSKYAIYIRKSRGEGNDVLSSHRATLTELAVQNNWRYDIYQEVGSGERIAARKEFQKLLAKVIAGNYKGVLVMDLDRLSRGNSRERGEIIETFQNSDTKIFTLLKEYDLQDTNEIVLIEIGGAIAHAELKKITFRFVTGKKRGAKDGKWVNGKPPFPYEYRKKIVITDNFKEDISGEVIVNEKQLETYKLMKEMYLSGRLGFESIAFELNKMGLLSANQNYWSSVTVQRTLLHEFHMGIVTYGKSKWIKTREGKSKMVAKRNDDEISYGVGKHQTLKTKEEHKKMLDICKKNNKIPSKSRECEKKSVKTAFYDRIILIIGGCFYYGKKKRSNERRKKEHHFCLA